MEILFTLYFKVLYLMIMEFLNSPHYRNQTFVLFLYLSLLAGLLACRTDPERDTGSAGGPVASIPFNAKNWQARDGDRYPYRDGMLDAVLHTDTIRGLKRTRILELLGPPDRQADGHLYYLVDQTRLAFWPLHSKFLVVKLEADDTVAWIRVHE